MSFIEDAKKEVDRKMAKSEIEIEEDYTELWNRLQKEVPKVAGEAMLLYKMAKKSFKNLREEVDRCNFEKVAEKLGDISAARQGTIELAESMHPESTVLKEMNNELRSIHENAWDLKIRFAKLCECKRKGEI